MTIKLATWNINSVRLRAPIVLDYMASHQPDILCLQETKCPDDLFPAQQFIDAGYPHIHFSGMKGYNGVCIFSKLPFKDVQAFDRVGKQDCRHISAAFEGFDVHNLYIPAGGDEPDRAVNEKFGHKLDFITEITDFFKNTYTPDKPVITVGDFNIAPREHDVWSSKQLQKVVSHTPIELEHLAEMYASLNWQDAIRHFVPDTEKCYSWWSYRNRDWKKSNRGRRLDHIWVTQPLAARLKSHDIHLPARDLEKPSDHVPVMIEFDL